MLMDAKANVADSENSFASESQHAAAALKPEASRSMTNHSYAVGLYAIAEV